MFRGIRSPVTRSWYGSRGGFYTPLRISTCVLWLHADDYVAATGAWPDRSAGENDGSQGTADSRPTAATMNGRTAASFDGSDDFIIVDGLESILEGEGGAWTCVALAVNDAGGFTITSLSFGATAANTPNKRCEAASNETMATHSTGDDTIAATHTGTATMTEGVPVSLAWRDTGTAMDTAIAATWDTPTVYTADTMTGMTRATIGAFRRGATPTISGYWGGDIREIAVFSAALTDAQVKEVMNGMRKRCGLGTL